MSDREQNREMEDKLMAWASGHNLNWLIRFHNNVRGLFKKELQELEKTGDNQEIEYKMQESALSDYERILNKNTFLMMFSYLEEWLYLYREKYTRKTTLVRGEGSLGRFKNVAREAGVDLTSKLWQELKGSEDLRDCLLHANGRVDFINSRDKKLRTERVIENNKPDLAIETKRIKFSGKYLESFNKNISEILDIMFGDNGDNED